MLEVNTDWYRELLLISSRRPELCPPGPHKHEVKYYDNKRGKGASHTHLAVRLGRGKEPDWSAAEVIAGVLLRKEVWL